MLRWASEIGRSGVGLRYSDYCFPRDYLIPGMPSRYIEALFAKSKALMEMWVAVSVWGQFPP